MCDMHLTREVRGTVTSNFGYDDAGQLTSDASSSYGYDAAGNRNSGGFAATTGNRMTTDGTWNYGYDDEGNQTRKDHVSTSYYWTYEYGNKNELLKAKYYNAGGVLQKEVQYKYDALGNRIQKDYITGGVTTTTRYVVDGWNPAKAGSLGSSEFDVWADLNGGNTLVTRFMRGDGVDEIWAEIGATAYWTLPDRMGSVSDIVDQGGVVKNQIIYDGFGRIVSQTDANYGSRYKWTGREYDVEIEMQYNRARYYDPNTGRWISQDPLGFDAGDSNLYRYVWNMPTRGADASGLNPGLWNAIEKRAELAEQRQNWEKGRFEAWALKPYKDPVVPNAVPFNAELRWFKEADGWDLLHYVAIIDAALTRIRRDLVDNSDRHPDQLAFRSNPTVVPMRNETYGRLSRWFGNGDPLTRGHVYLIYQKYSQVQKGIRKNTTIYYDDSDTLKGWGQVTWYPLSSRHNTIQLGERYFAGSKEQKIATLIHELTHLYANTEDYGYYDDPQSLQPENKVTYREPQTVKDPITLSPNQQVNNADSYAGFLVQYYLK